MNPSFRKKCLCVFLVSLSVLGFSIFPQAKGWVLDSDCRWAHDNITYYNGASSVENFAVPLAATYWADTPTMVYFSTASQQNANVAVQSVNDPSASYYGVTYTATCGGTFAYPVYNGQTIIKLNDAQLNGKSQDLIIESGAHELGHSLGLAHSQVQLLSCGKTRATM